ASANKIDSGLQSIIIGTRATGETAMQLGEDFRSVLGSGLPVSVDAASGAITELNTLLGATGPVLQQLTGDVTNASRMLGEDGATNASLFGKALNQFKMSAEEGLPVTDQLFKLTQDFGIGLGPLLQNLNSYGSVLQNANFSMSESAVIFSQLQKGGLAVSRIMPGLNGFFRKMADAGLDGRSALQEVVQAMKSAGTETEALKLATKAFGAEGAQRLTTAIRNNIVSFDNLTSVLDGSKGVIQETSDRTLTFSDRLVSMKNRIMLAAEPLGNKLLDAFSQLEPYIIRGIEFVADLTDKFTSLSGPTQATILGVGGLAAAIGPALLAFSGIASVVGGLISVLPALIAGVAAVAAPVAVATAAIVSWGVAIKTTSDNWDLLVSGTGEMLERLKGSIAGKFQEIIDSFKFLGDHFKTVGNNIVSGLWSGIESKLAWLKGKMQDAADLVPDTFKKVLQISSPSKVMEVIGYQTALGMAKGTKEGLNAEIPGILDELTEMKLGSYEADRLNAKQKAGKILENEELNAEARKGVAEWLRLKLEEINNAEEEDATRTQEEITRNYQKEIEKRILSSGTLADGWNLALGKMQQDMLTWGEVGYNTFKDVTGQMGDTFGDVLIDGMEGELQTFESYFCDFLNSIASNFLKMMGDMAAQNFMSTVFGGGGGFGGGGLPGMLFSGGTTAAGAAGSTAAGAAGTAAGGAGVGGVGGVMGMMSPAGWAAAGTAMHAGIGYAGGQVMGNWMGASGAGADMS
ncbi:MAG: hypothetical protein GY841_16860, partial [FCB group bacterium]|nr:hypothetical protein [FCB group bacterium]